MRMQAEARERGRIARKATDDDDFHVRSGRRGGRGPARHHPDCSRPVVTVPLTIAMLAVLFPCGARAQPGGGLYLSQELGANFTPGLNIEIAAPNAPGSICDEHLNPFTDLMPAFCSDPNAPGTAWTNSFDGAGGILAGGALGYRFTGSGRLRGELEYFYRETAHNETSAVEGSSGAAVAKLDDEVVVAQDRIGSLTSHNLFGNVYFDFTSRSRVTPYVGVGAGVGFTQVDHGLLWVRNSDPDLITSIIQYFPADRQDDLRVVQQNLASTTTSSQTELGARLFGYQVLFGVDVALTESTALGVKGRRVAFGSFSDATGLDRVRSHAPSNRLDGSAPGLTALTTGDLVLYGFSLNLKYQF